MPWWTHVLHTRTRLKAEVQDALKNTAALPRGVGCGGSQPTLSAALAPRSLRVRCGTFLPAGGAAHECLRADTGARCATHDPAPKVRSVSSNWNAEMSISAGFYITGRRYAVVRRSSDGTLQARSRPQTG